MKITLKTLQRETFEVEIEETKTVKDLKAKIEEVKGEGYAASNLKLIYAGKILVDDRVLEEYGITNFIVVMISKPKASSPADDSATSTQTAPTSTASAPTTATTTTANPPATAPAQTAPAPAPPAQTAPAPVTDSTPTDATSNMFVSGSEYDNAVQEMISMGFERMQIERAMAASFMNPHRAIEYLFNPESMPQHVPPAAGGGNPQQQQQAPPATGGGAPPSATTPGSTPAAPVAGGLDFLRNSRQMQALRRMVAEDPSMLQEILEEVGSANPQLLQAIQANPEQFMRLLGEGGNEAAGGTPGAEQQPAADRQGGTGLQIPVTTEEKAAIDRIKALGFPEHMAIEAYFACEKNENLAAEFLLSENIQDDS